MADLVPGYTGNSGCSISHAPTVVDVSLTLLVEKRLKSGTTCSCLCVGNKGHDDHGTF